MPENEDTEIETQVGCCCCAKVSKRAKKLLHNKTASSSNTKVPFYADLPRELALRTVIHARGNILPECSRFAIDLTCGRAESSDIAFHFNPRLLQRYIVRNSKLNGRWGEEEWIHYAKFNLERGEKFDISIQVLEDSFLVAVNEQVFCSFNFRTPLARIKGLRISGAVEAQGVEFENAAEFPKTKTVDIQKRQKEEESEDNDTFQDTPLAVLLPQGFRQGWQLEIYGRVKILPHSFYINLQEGSQQWPHPNVALHLNPRFGHGREDSVFVRNSWINGKGWGGEERSPEFQFSPGSPFHMVIRRANDHFSVWIDGKLVGEFKFRTDPDQIDTLYIHGDLRIRKMILEEEPSSLLDLSTQNLNFSK